MKNCVDLLGGIHGEPENDSFHKQNLDYLKISGLSNNKQG